VLRIIDRELICGQWFYDIKKFFLRGSTIVRVFSGLSSDQTQQRKIVMFEK
jgi:hypothetical protein